MSRHGNRGTARLAAGIDGRARRHARPAYVKDLGKITSSGGLLLDRYPREIPAGDYLVDAAFTTERSIAESGGSGEASFASHNHRLRAPLAAGDRVHVDILDGGQDEWTAIVVGRL